MVQVAVISDIHGNFPALQAVIEDLHHVSPDVVVVDGDIINRGPQSRECLAAVRAQNWAVVYGNHEEHILRRRAPRVPPEWLIPFFAPFQEVADCLSADEAATLERLPRAFVLRLDGLPAVRIVHASPRALTDGIGPWMDTAELDALLDMIPEPVLVGAHTHRPFTYRRDDGHKLLNCGAVGISYNGDPRAQYLLLHGERGAWRPEFRAVPYDLQRVREVYAARGAFRHVFTHLSLYELETATFHRRAYFVYCREQALDFNALESFHRYRQDVGDRTRAGHITPPPPLSER